MIIGYDISSTPAVEKAGLGYREAGRRRALESILAGHGATHARLRVWVDPPVAGSDLPNVLRMAKRVKEAGLELVLDLHYSDYWADPAKQPIPSRWANQDLPTLAVTVREYTASVLRDLDEQGSPAGIVQIGNEVTNGMMWPQGRLYEGKWEGWDQFTTLLEAGIAGARRATASSPLIMIHIDRGGDNRGSRSFFDQLQERGVDFDLIGLSYYPWWHGRLTDLSENLHDLAQRYTQPLMIAETAYPWTAENHDDTANMVTESTPLQTDFPASVEGQLGFLRELRTIVESLPNGRGAGIVYWEPAWLPGVGLGDDTGNGWDNLTLFGPDGDTLSSIEWAR